jgi:hypothetical protein
VSELARTESHVDIRSYAGTNASDLDFVKIKSQELEEIKRLLQSVVQGSRAIRIKIDQKEE